MKRITLRNVVSNLVLQILTITNFIIVPKIILIYFGSEVNGLVSSINQFLSYISIIEGGITGVITANLYKPLIDKNYEKISSIYITTKKFYTKIAYIFIVYSLLLGITYPLIFNIEFSFKYVFLLTLILSMNLLVQYMFSLTNKTILQADKKMYIISITQSIIIVLNIILAFLSVKIFPSIHLMKLLTGILYLIQPIVYNYFINKYYKIEQLEKVDKSLLKQRWNGFAINIAAFVHISTDITLLTVFTDLKTVSVYSVYTLVSNGLKQIETSITSAFIPTIGQLYAKQDTKELNRKMDIYEYIVFISVFFLFSIGIMLITPFILLYTRNIIDTNYNQPIFGILLLISEGLYLIKTHHLNLAYSANKFKEITIPSFIEAAINIIISLLLVKKYKLIGIMIGTIAAMLYRMIFHVYYTNKKLIKRKQIIFYKKFIIFSTSSFALIMLCKTIIPIDELSIFQWLIHGILYSIFFIITYYFISLLFFKNEFHTIKEYLFKRGKN